MNDAIWRVRTFGTDEPVAEPQRLEAGPLDCLIANGTVRAIRWHGVEVVRAIDCPIRDASWGTWAQENVTERWPMDANGLRYERRFNGADGALDALLQISLHPDGKLEAHLTLTARTDCVTNRAGFTVLHPLVGVSGEPVTVTHPDGRQSDTRFPMTISPSQPVFDISALHHSVRGVDVEFRFNGDVFEMEDQRNWSDASFKTYCRPLALPLPYTLATGSVVEQRIVLHLAGVPSDQSQDTAVRSDNASTTPSVSAPTATAATTGDTAQVTTALRMPDLLLAAEPEWLRGPTAESVITHRGCRGLLLRLHDLPNDETMLERLSALLGNGKQYLDLEAVVPEGREATAYLQALAASLNVFDLVPNHVIALPEAYLASYQPDSNWPEGMTPEEAFHAATEVFAESRIGVGMLTNFTELNRCRPGAGLGDYITHANTATVHAADDRSVLETLEAIPQILSSTHTFAVGRTYRLGLISIGMRSNPYGPDVAPNPQNRRVAMAQEDPRQHGLFAAAYAVAVAACAAEADVEAVALAAPVGPFALCDANGCRPICHVVQAMAALQGKPLVKPVGYPAGTHAITARTDGDPAASAAMTIIANTCLNAVNVPLAHAATVRVLDTNSAVEVVADPQWLQTANTTNTQSIELAPLAVAFVEHVG